MRTVLTPAGLVLAGLAIVFISGCGAADNREHLGADVSGQVTLDGSRVEGATVTFRPTDATLKGAFGNTDAEGNFTLSSSPATVGIQPGTYQVSVTKMKVVQSTAPAEGEPGYTGNPAPTPPPKSLLPEKYGNPRTSGLEVTVSEGENSIPLRLEK